ncbi:cofilin [Coemansia erecta]|uniref:Cofilin n=1 Tax=Coemansia erecta TaxID=147472 RepID=A0A9W7XZ26_9FUNG|nr:cofilin [Coemansia erecta]
MSSGIPVNEDCLKAFDAMKRLRLYKYVIFQMNADFTDVVVGHRYRAKKVSGDSSEIASITEGETAENTSNLEGASATEEEVFADFLKHLPENECRYVIYDIEYTKKDVTSNKIVFVTWAPDTAKIKPKMLYSSTKNNLSKRLEGVTTHIQANDLDEVTLDSFQEKLQRV